MWGERLGVQNMVRGRASARNSTILPARSSSTAVGGWIALAAVLLLGARRGRYRKDGTVVGIPPSNIPFLALGAWVLAVGWFGFNVMSAQKLDDITGLVAVNSLMAMAGGLLAATVAGKNDPGFVHNGPLAGLVAVCAGSTSCTRSARWPPAPSPARCSCWPSTSAQNRWRIDDVLGVWPLHGLCGAVGRHRVPAFSAPQSLGGMGGVSFWRQVVGSLGRRRVRASSPAALAYRHPQGHGRHPLERGRGIRRRRSRDSQDRRLSRRRHRPPLSNRDLVSPPMPLSSRRLWPCPDRLR